ncbi:MAG TPA: hypothetical protein IGS37_00665 [Synechococcales cyanobacterium M55_K2018_004]|nr:hypothetical protein [Synechococcales cyanobacterium M55_K2018_004]
MAGLFGLFRKKNNNVSETTDTKGSNSKAYFLDPDDAKTLGDIEYMRSAKTVKRTFPRTATNGGEFEQVKRISAMDMQSVSGMNNVGNAASSNGTLSDATKARNEEVENRRRTDSSMDMFRNMARDIKKR